MIQDHSLPSIRAASRFNRWHVWLLGALLLVSGFTLNACSGGGGGSSSTGNDTGTALIGLTDADGDFITYTVDVTALTLTRADGAVVNALPVTTRVDFAQYTDLTEFLNAATVPSGNYTHVSMTLDYTNAVISVAQGNNALMVKPVDGSGNAITSLTLQVDLDGNKPLVVRPGLPSNMTLDFDLQATNSVDLNNATVTVSPVLVADVEPANPKPHRVRGPLLSVNPAANQFVVAIRPFHLLLGDFGQLTVQTDGNTQYEIDRVSYQGATGLAQLANEPRLTATVAIGNFDPATHSFLATEVYAGSSVAFGTSDVVTGSVIARSNDTLTVRGASLTRVGGTVTFNDSVTVTLDPNTTKVTRQLGGTAGIGDISVGSRITAFGSFSGPINNLTLDTTGGLVRILLSSVAGTVSQIAPSLVTVNLQTLNGRPVALYSFSGTGSDPTAYRVGTGSLDLSALATSDPVRVRGFAVAYGQVTTQDYSAQTLIDLANVPAWLAIYWPAPVTNPFASLTNQAMVTDISGSSLHSVFQNGVATVLATNPTVQPDGAANDRFVIVRNNSIQLYGSFTSFSNALNLQLATHTVAGVGARGSWNSGTATVTGGFAVVKLQ
ncbi:MAG: DUF4382 domain-containing protein [Sulfuricaulis sp.]